MSGYVSAAKRAREADDDLDSSQLQLSPITIDKFCDTAIALFLTASDTRTMKLSHVFRAKAMQEDDSMKEFDREHETTRADVQHAFNVLYRKASQTNVVTAESAVTVVKAYVNSGESIEMHPRYPTNPLSAYNLYLKEHGIGKFDKNDEARGAFSQDPKMKKKYEELYKVKLVEHVRDLKQFLKNETDLKEEHINFVTNRLRTYERKIDPKSVPKKKRIGGKKKKEIKSAFEYFKQSKSGSYTDLEADAREKKLLKKFNRLPDEMRQIFDDLATNN